MKPKYFCIEGPECSGKTSLVNALKEQIDLRHCVFLPEIPLSLSRLYTIGSSASDEFEVALLSVTAIMMAQIQEMLEHHKLVVSDRSWVSNMAYAQTRKKRDTAFEFDPEIHVRQARVFSKLFPQVFDNMLLFSIDVPPVISLQRWNDRASRQIEPGHEPDLGWLTLAYQEYEAALRVVQRSFPTVQIVRADGRENPESILQQAISTLGIEPGELC